MPDGGSDVSAAGSRSACPPRGSVSFTDWLVTLFIAVIPGVSIIMLIYWSFFTKKTDFRRNFGRAYLIAAPFAIIMTLALFALFVYFFGIPILTYFVEHNPPKIY
jgi:hypothetical protein